MSDRHHEIMVKLGELRNLVDYATLGPWRSLESRDTWTLYGEAREFKGKLKHGAGPSMQIIKAPKHGTPYAEFWPNAADGKLIVEAVNRFSFFLDWAEGVATRHFPTPCGCQIDTHFLCSANRAYSWEECPEVIGLVMAVEMLHSQT